MRKLIVFVSNISDYTTSLVNELNNMKIPIKCFYGASSEYYSNICGIKDKILYENELLDLINKKKDSFIGLNGGIEWIINEQIISVLPTLNLHPSLLPKNRGSHHSFWAIMNDENHGATLHWMDSDLDTGPILNQKSISNDFKSTAGKVQKQSEELCLELLKESIVKILSSEKLPVGKLQGEGTFHYKSEIKKGSTFNLDEIISFKKLLKICRATCAKDNGFYIQKDGKEFAKIIIKDIQYFDNSVS